MRGSMDSMGGIDRLAHALRLFLEYRAHPSPPAAWLRANADYRDLLEPMLAEVEGDAALGDTGAPDDRGDPAVPDSTAYPSLRMKRSESTGEVESLGPYRVLRVLGEGGMGTVYLAEQVEPIRRRVALKVIRRGMETRDAIARFQAERQALARMDHPYVAKVLDAGTTTDRRPFFVMEYVSGDRLTRFCDERKLTLRDRIALFAEVCDGVHHAHQQGIIHRDLKPSNVIVSVVDGRPVPKIIDFGIAKWTGEHDRDGRTAFETRTGGILGTPDFMSPEQLDRSSGRVDTRTDVYSLGVLLYELLVGRLPFEIETRTPEGIAELVRLVRDVDPPRPSTRILSLADSAAELAADRADTVRNWRRGLRGDLDWIVLRCLEKDRGRRYDSAAGLAEDLRRYLAHETVRASPPSSLYRARKLVRRNRGLFAAVAVVLVSLVGGLGWALREKSRADDEAAALAKEVYRANIALAAAEIDDGRLASARRALGATVPELRDWEWRYYQGQLEPSVHGIEGLRGDICALDIAPDGRTLATAMADGTIRVQDLRSGEVVRTIVTEGIATQCSLDRAGRRLSALGVADRSAGARRWIATWQLPGGELRSFHWLDPSVDFATGSLYPFDRGFAAPLADIHAESRRAALSTSTGVRIYDLDSATLLAERPLDGRPRTVRFAPSGRTVVLATKYTPIELVDAVTLETRAVLKGLDLWSFAIRPDETQFAASEGAGLLALWDLDPASGTGDPAEPRLIEAGQGAVHSIAYSDDGSRLVTIGDDMSPRTWDTRTGEPSGLFPALEERQTHLFAVPGSEEFATVGSGGELRVWSDEGRDATVLRGHESFVYYVDVDVERGLIASGGWDGYSLEPGAFRLWDLESGDPVAVWGDPDVWSQGVRFAPEADALLGVAFVHPRGRKDPDVIQRVSRIDLGSGAESISVRPIVADWAESGAGDAIWAISDLGELLRLDPRTGVPTIVETPSERTWAQRRIAASPDGGTIAISSTSRVVLRSAGADRGVIHDLGVHEGLVTDLDFDPSGRVLISASEDGTVVVWDVESGEALATLGHDVGVLSARFHPGGTRIATGARDGTVRIWSAESYDPLATLRGHASYVHQVCWQDDGERLFSASGDGTIRIWETEPVRVRLRARQQRRALVERLTPAVEAWLAERGPTARIADFVAETGTTPREAQVARQILLGIRLGRAPE